MTAFASLFHDDGVWVLWTGEVWTGRRVIEDGHAAVHKTIFRNSTQREHIEELTFVGPDAAIVRFCSVLTGSEQSPNEPIRSRKFLVMTRRQGVWKVSWGQNTGSAPTFPSLSASRHCASAAADHMIDGRGSPTDVTDRE